MPHPSAVDPRSSPLTFCVDNLPKPLLLLQLTLHHLGCMLLYHLRLQLGLN